MPKQDSTQRIISEIRILLNDLGIEASEKNSEFPYLESVVAEELKRARQSERERALDLAMNYYINRPVGSSIPVVISKEMYKRLLDGELDEALKKRVKEEQHATEK